MYSKVKIKCDPRIIKFGCTNGGFKAPISKLPLSMDINVDLSDDSIEEIIVYVTLKK